MAFRLALVFSPKVLRLSLLRLKGLFLSRRFYLTHLKPRRAAEGKIIRRHYSLYKTPSSVPGKRGNRTSADQRFDLYGKATYRGLAAECEVVLTAALPSAAKACQRYRSSQPGTVE